MKLPIHALQWGTLDRLFRWVWLGLLMWLAVLAIGAGVRSLRTSGQAAAAITEYKRIQTEAALQKEDIGGRIKNLTDKNLFAPPAEKPKLPQCAAILGGAALFGDQWHTVGEIVSGAKILDIGPSFVKVLFEDKEQRLVPFDVEVKSPGSGGQGPSGPSGDRGRPPESSPGPVLGAVPSEGRPDSGPPSGGRGEEMRRRFESMTPEQRRQIMERYQNASPQEREQMKDQFRRGREQ